MKNFIVLIAIALATVHTTYSCICSQAKSGEEVCGSNGETYSSECLLSCESFYRGKDQPCVTKVSDGKCGPSPCVCNDTCDYVCASNKQTYGNECTLKCAQKLNPDIAKVKNGQCDV